MAGRAGSYLVKQLYREDAAEPRSTATAGASEWLDQLQSRAAERFAETGFPTSRDEEWRFTPVGPIAKTAWQEPAGSSSLSLDELKPFLFGQPDWPRLVFINGFFDEALSTVGALPRGVTVSRLAEALRRDGSAVRSHLGRYGTIDASAFTALNTARFTDGAFIALPANAQVRDPIHLIFVSNSASAGSAVHPRSLVLVGQGARASVLESYLGIGAARASFTNPVTEVVLAPNAWLEHTRIQRESETAYHIGATYVHQSRDSHYRSFSLAMGAVLARHNLHARLDAENVETLLYGLYLTRGNQLVDNHTAIYHDQPNCRSWEVYKGILDGRSRAVFNGKVFVKPEAQKTDAKQTNRNLLLTDHTRVDTKPQLEIFADDVKCTHGATVGRLDDIALFYTRSRGVPAAEAQRLLTYAFAAEVIEEVVVDPVRLELENLVRHRLGVEST
jgi:Fe-S cluster assembly protein SufD